MRAMSGVQWWREGILGGCLLLGSCTSGTQGHGAIVSPSLATCLSLGDSVVAVGWGSLAAGAYSLELLAQSGGRAGSGTTGDLTMVQSDSPSSVPSWVYPKDNPKVTTPFWGWTTIVPDSIGASS